MLAQCHFCQSSLKTRTFDYLMRLLNFTSSYSTSSCCLILFKDSLWERIIGTPIGVKMANFSIKYKNNDDIY